MKKMNWLFVSILFSMVLGCASSDTGDGNDDNTDCRNDGRGCTTGFACSVNAAGEYECLPAEGSGDADAGNTNAGSTNTPVQCVEEGDNCTQESDCCNAGMFTCIGVTAYSLVTMETSARADAAQASILRPQMMLQRFVCRSRHVHAVKQMPPAPLMMTVAASLIKTVMASRARLALTTSVKIHAL